MTRLVIGIILIVIGVIMSRSAELKPAMFRLISKGIIATGTFWKLSVSRHWPMRKAIKLG